MGALRIGLMVIGVLMLPIGLMWVGQGFGVVQFPAQSFMFNEMTWAYRGIGTAVAGALLMFLSRKV